MTAAETYASQVDDFNAQQARIYGERLLSDTWATGAPNYRYDPQRELTGMLSKLASYVDPDDVVTDVGGGAGYVSLPLALRCRQVINVDASPGMLKEFGESAKEAGITNVRSVLSDWLDSKEMSCDLAVTRDVTYFVGKIVPFVGKMASAARRRVIIVMQSVPIPNQTSPLFQLVYGEQQVPVPGHRELLPVLWEMDILPDVHMMGGSPIVDALTREDAVASAMVGRWLPPGDRDLARSLIEANFEKLHEEFAEGFRPLWRRPSREMLITWET